MKILQAIPLIVLLLFEHLSFANAMCSASDDSSCKTISIIKDKCSFFDPIKEPKAMALLPNWIEECSKRDKWCEEEKSRFIDMGSGVLIEGNLKCSPEQHCSLCNSGKQQEFFYRTKDCLISKRSAPCFQKDRQVDFTKIGTL